MTPERDNSKLVRPVLNVLLALGWLSVALQRFDMRGYHALHPHGGYVLFAVGAVVFLANAAYGFRDWLHSKPEKPLTIFGLDYRNATTRDV